MCWQLTLLGWSFSGHLCNCVVIDPTQVHGCQKWYWDRHLAAWLYKGQGQSYSTDIEWRGKPIHLLWLSGKISMQPLEFKCSFVYLIFKWFPWCVLCLLKHYVHNSLFCLCSVSSPLFWNAFPLFSSLLFGNLFVVLLDSIEYVF